MLAHRSFLLVAASLISAFTLASCTGDPDCDEHQRQLARAWEVEFRFDCTPGFPGVRGGTNIPIAGWTDVERETLWIWPENISSANSLSKIMWHELGHATHYRRYGTTGTERWADAYSWCQTPYPELHYLVRPTATQCRTTYL